MTAIAVGGRSPAGLRWPSYFNGRLLTATDLDATQDAVVTRDRWLGSAMGAGVAAGLVVTGTPGDTTLQVSPGLAITPCGTAVHLDAPAVIDLAVVSSNAPVTGSMFADCEPGGVELKAPSAGAYLLTMSPSSAFDGKVPVQAANGALLPAPCGSRWEVEGVTFRAILLDEFTAKTTFYERRNRLAHFCFGSAAMAPLALGDWTSPLPYRPIDALADLTDCDVPLAVFDWTGSELRFADLWSARRRVVRPSAATLLGPIVSDDRDADGEARFLQFQDQLGGLLSTAAGAGLVAQFVFPLLPPAGLLPIDPLAAVSLLADLVPAAPDAPAAPAAVGPEEAVALGRRQAEEARRKQIGEVLQGYGSVPGKLGSVSGAIRDLQADVQALQDEVDALTAQVSGGVAGPDAAEKARRRQGLLDLVALLADVPSTGVELNSFFAGVNVRFGVIDRDEVDALIRRSWCREATVLEEDPSIDVLFVTGYGQVAGYVVFTRRKEPRQWLTDPTHLER